jgi:hypothetical protein
VILGPIEGDAACTLEAVATKKQQRRKYRRAVGRGRLHDGYEPKAPEERPQGRAKRPAASSRVRTPIEPSLWRSARRAAIFALLFSLGFDLLGLYRNATTGAKVAQTLFFFAVLWWSGYLAERFNWRRYQKKLRQPPERG